MFNFGANGMFNFGAIGTFNFGANGIFNLGGIGIDSFLISPFDVRLILNNGAYGTLDLSLLGSNEVEFPKVISNSSISIIYLWSVYIDSFNKLLSIMLNYSSFSFFLESNVYEITS